MTDTTTAPPAWRKGYDLDLLKRITALWAGQDAGHQFGAFTRMDEATVATDLAEGRLYVDSYEDPHWGFVGRVLKTSTTVNDWRRSKLVKYGKGTVVIRRAVAEDDGPSLADLTAAVEGFIESWGPDHADLFGTGLPAVVLEGWAGHPTTEHLADHLGLTWQTSKVPAGAEVIGCWADTIAPQHPLSEQAGIVSLDLDVDPVLRAQLLIQMEAAGLKWADHYSGYNLRQSWSAVALRGYSADPDFISKPTEMAKKWKAEHPDLLDATVEPTPLWHSLPAARAIVEDLGWGTQRVRLMRLRADVGELARHADITDPDAGVQDGQVARIHVPLITNDEVLFQTWDMRKGAPRLHHMPVGVPTYLDTRKPHRAVNTSHEDRIHLVVDVIADARLRALLGD